MRLYDADGNELLLVPCAECIYCSTDGSGQEWICERTTHLYDGRRHVEPDGFCSNGGKDINGYIYKTGETLESVGASQEGLGYGR